MYSWERHERLLCLSTGNRLGPNPKVVATSTKELCSLMSVQCLVGLSWITSITSVRLDQNEPAKLETSEPDPMALFNRMVPPRFTSTLLAFFDFSCGKSSSYHFFWHQLCRQPATLRVTISNRKCRTAGKKRVEQRRVEANWAGTSYGKRHKTQNCVTALAHQANPTHWLHCVSFGIPSSHWVLLSTCNTCHA